jgi:hypothetical protein
MLTMFREGGAGSPVSMRRVLAAFFALAAVALFAASLPVTGWAGALPGALCLAAVLILLFFTTWGEVAAAVRTVTSAPLSASAPPARAGT